MARSVYRQVVSRILSALLFRCSPCFRRLQFENLTDLAQIKVMDHVYDIISYADTISTRANPLPSTFLELQPIYWLRVLSVPSWTFRVLGSAGKVAAYYELRVSRWWSSYLIRSNAIINKLVCTFVSSSIPPIHIIFSDHVLGQHGFTHQASRNANDNWQLNSLNVRYLHVVFVPLLLWFLCVLPFPPCISSVLTRHLGRFSLLPTPSSILHSFSVLVVVSTPGSYIGPLRRSLTTFAVYTNSLLATLNARKTIAKSTESSGDTMSLSLRDLPIMNNQVNRVFPHYP